MCVCVCVCLVNCQRVMCVISESIATISNLCHQSQLFVLRLCVFMSLDSLLICEDCSIVGIEWAVRISARYGGGRHRQRWSDIGTILHFIEPMPCRSRCELAHTHSTISRRMPQNSTACYSFIRLFQPFLLFMVLFSFSFTFSLIAQLWFDFVLRFCCELLGNCGTRNSGRRCRLVCRSPF